MLIRCPNCGESGETDSEPDVGQHIECPFCGTTFSYCEDQTEPMQENAQMQEVHEVKCVGNKSITKSEDACDETAKGARLPCGLTLVAKKKTGSTLPGGASNGMPVAVNPVHRRVIRKQIGLSRGKTRSLIVNIKPKKKFCQECGNELHPKAVICPKCGCPVTRPKQPTSWSSIDPNDVSDYMVGAIISIFLFLPMGLVAMYYVLQSRQKLKDGDRYGAEDDSRTAGVIVKWTIGIAVIGFVFWLIWGFWIGYAMQKEMKAADDYMRKAMQESERIMRSVDYYY